MPTGSPAIVITRYDCGLEKTAYISMKLRRPKARSAARPTTRSPPAYARAYRLTIHATRRWNSACVIPEKSGRAERCRHASPGATPGPASAIVKSWCTKVGQQRLLTATDSTQPARAFSINAAANRTVSVSPQKNVVLAAVPGRLPVRPMRWRKALTVVGAST